MCIWLCGSSICFINCILNLVYSFMICCGTLCVNWNAGHYSWYQSPGSALAYVWNSLFKITITYTYAYITVTINSFSYHISLIPYILSFCLSIVSQSNPNPSFFREMTSHCITSSSTTFQVEDPNMMELLKGLVRTNINKMEILQQELVTGRQKMGIVSDFRKLNPLSFYETEEVMKAKQLLEDTENLLDATRVEDEGRVEMIKINSWILLAYGGWPRRIGWIS